MTMDNLPDSVADDVNNFEVTVEPGHLTLIVSTTDGNLHTYTFSTGDDGVLALQSQTENGQQVEGEIGDVARTLLLEHPVISPSEIAVD